MDRMLAITLGLVAAGAVRRIFILCRTRCRVISSETCGDAFAWVITIASAVTFAIWLSNTGTSGSHTRYYANGVNVTGIVESLPAKLLISLVIGFWFSGIAQFILLALFAAVRKLVLHPFKSVGKHPLVFLFVTSASLWLWIAFQPRENILILIPYTLRYAFLCLVWLLNADDARERLRKWIPEHKFGFGLTILYEGLMTLITAASLYWYLRRLA